jgi:hypothetical protein
VFIVFALVPPVLPDHVSIDRELVLFRQLTNALVGHVVERLAHKAGLPEAGVLALIKCDPVDDLVIVPDDADVTAEGVIPVGFAAVIAQQFTIV